MGSPATGARWVWGGLLGLLGVAALAWSNPGEREFEAFAAEQLVKLASEELCSSGGLPLLARLVVQNCPELISSQRQVLGRLAGSATRRYNAGVFSLYSTELGGERLLPGLSLPRYRALTLAAAGQLVLLEASADTQQQRH